MIRTIITLTFTLSIFSIAFGQNFNKDLKEGLYLWSSGFVIEQTSGSLQVVQLKVSKAHFYKTANVVFDSVTRARMLSESDPMWDEVKTSDMVRLFNPSKIVDIVQFQDKKIAVIFKAKKGFNSANFIKRDFGYEMYFSNHDVKRKIVKESILNDTLTYFTLSAFTLTDLKNLRMLKSFDDITQKDFESLKQSVSNASTKYKKLFKADMTFGIKMEGYKTYGIIEMNELFIKGLLELQYNPLINLSKIDEISRKYSSTR